MTEWHLPLLKKNIIYCPELVDHYNQTLSSGFYEALFTKLYARCRSHSSRHSFRFKRKLFSLDASLLDVSMKVFPSAEYNRMKAAYKLHIGLDHDGLIPAFAAVTAGKTGDQTQPCFG